MLSVSVEVALITDVSLRFLFACVLACLLGMRQVRDKDKSVSLSQVAGRKAAAGAGEDGDGEAGAGGGEDPAPPQQQPRDEEDESIAAEDLKEHIAKAFRRRHGRGGKLIRLALFFFVCVAVVWPSLLSVPNFLVLAVVVAALRVCIFILCHPFRVVGRGTF